MTTLTIVVTAQYAIFYDIDRPALYGLLRSDAFSGKSEFSAPGDPYAQDGKMAP